MRAGAQRRSGGRRHRRVCVRRDGQSRRHARRAASDLARVLEKHRGLFR